VPGFVRLRLAFRGTEEPEPRVIDRGFDPQHAAFTCYTV
jgi:hypothetical protein